MTESGNQRRENEALRERISTLTAAILRISATLDLDTVLAEAVESARRLTGARYGAIVTVDETGAHKDYVLSGFTPEQRQEVVVWPDNVRLFRRFRERPGPLRIANLPDYLGSLGISPSRAFSRSLLGMPMHHRDADVGNFFLAEKEYAPAFTDDDEEVLVLFATQAAAEIANARTHRDERQARADLAALVETSPVGGRGL